VQLNYVALNVLPINGADDRRLLVSALEFETSGPPRRLQVSAFEFGVPAEPRRLLVSAFELEMPTSPRRLQVSAFELQTPDVVIGGNISCARLAARSSASSLRFVRGGR
jgi:hypothetical protein